VLLLDLPPVSREQAGLFDEALDTLEKTARCTEALDNINRHFGRQALRFASEMLSDRWQTRNRMKPPSYTTRWDELPVVKAQ